MTCIAGVIADDGSIVMGGDSANFCGTRLVLRQTPKVFRNGPFLIGCAGSLRVRDAMRYHFTPPKHPRGMDVQCFMRTVFIDAVRDSLRRAGTLLRKNEIEELIDSKMLVGYRRRLFEIEEDFQVGESFDEFSAVGCGADVANGALCVSGDVTPRKRILAALSAAERYNTGVRRPFAVLRLEAE